MQTRGGISRYFSELIRTFQDHPELGVLPILNIRFTINHHLAERFPELKLTLIKNPVLILILKIQASVFGLRSKSSAHIVHKTFYGLGLCSRNRSSIPIVTTLHDMIPEIYQKRINWFSAHLFKFRDLSRSDGVIAISNASLNQYREVTANPRTDVRVIHLGARVSQSSGNFALDGVPEKYFLFVGQRSGHKNAELVLRAFSRSGESDWNLVFVGGGPFSRKEKLLIKNLGLTNRVSWRVLADEKMSLAYRNASALIVPSKIEGFGLPLVEAALFGCPVFASRIPVFEEIMEDAAFYFDPVHPDELSTLMRSLISGELLLDRLKSSGDRIARRFSWYECASQTASYYKDIVSKHEEGRSSRIST